MNICDWCGDDEGFICRNCNRCEECDDCDYGNGEFEEEDL